MNPTRAFPLGRTVATVSVVQIFTIRDLAGLLRRHLRGDIGLLCPNDAEANRLAVKHGGRVLSRFDTPHGEVYVITEADRSSTTILFPDEY
ncbi:hypothetical protein [Phycisphaera mikurensis]|uniref:Uncharacterized protein n=1 Tax=Phycisphaera mikurensis (strain NBRC 102666 / KCTC 22515 / FYK2301M01) TaxID=1142394 RepID=I0IJD9_PHYMF|nr:hypothetical protein [Phycisphaera mikurensis]MBB6443205.1 hypothetical protein [Phycisphaera mikurensis]BAM05377.1 hypothetical protein PSMK_p00150 [Phycisphaera mikurensis NBRC 102666]